MVYNVLTWQPPYESLHNAATGGHPTFEPRALVVAAQVEFETRKLKAIYYTTVSSA